MRGARGSRRSIWTRWSPTSPRARPAVCARRAARRCPASATPTRNGCSSARRRAPKRTRRASLSSARPGSCSTTCSRRSASIARENVYIANVLKCRPPNNRDARAARGAGVRTVSRPADRADRAAADRRARQERRVPAARRRRVDREPAQSRASLSRHAADRHLSSGVPAAQPGRQGEGVGGPAVRAPHAARPWWRAGCRVVASAKSLARDARTAAYSGRRTIRFPLLIGRSNMLRKLGIVLAAVVALALGGCGYNDLQRQDEGIKASWSEVVNQYQRRADLVPNLVNTVKGYAQQEQQVLTEVTNARANVGSIKATPELINDPRGVPEVHPGAKPAAERAVAAASPSPRTIRSSSRMRCSATCSRSSKEPRTASPSRATATSRRCRNSTRRCVSSRPT